MATPNYGILSPAQVTQRGRLLAARRRSTLYRHRQADTAIVLFGLGLLLVFLAIITH